MKAHMNNNIIAKISITKKRHARAFVWMNMCDFVHIRVCVRVQFL